MWLSELLVPSRTSVTVLAAGYLLSKKSASTTVCWGALNKVCRCSYLKWICQGKSHVIKEFCLGSPPKPIFASGITQTNLPQTPREQTTQVEGRFPKKVNKTSKYLPWARSGIWESAIHRENQTVFSWISKKKKVRIILVPNSRHSVMPFQKHQQPLVDNAGPEFLYLHAVAGTCFGRASVHRA